MKPDLTPEQKRRQEAVAQAKFVRAYLRDHNRVPERTALPLCDAIEAMAARIEELERLLPWLPRDSQEAPSNVRAN